jgi:hypothetical protein
LRKNKEVIDNKFVGDIVMQAKELQIMMFQCCRIILLAALFAWICGDCRSKQKLAFPVATWGH